MNVGHLYEGFLRVKRGEAVPDPRQLLLESAIVSPCGDGRPERHAGAFEAAIHAVDPTLSVVTTPLSTIVAASSERQRLGMWLMGGFGVVALVLATMGMFGVIAYVVSERTSEFRDG